MDSVMENKEVNQSAIQNNHNVQRAIKKLPNPYEEYCRE
jgi:hypothetical protein